VVRFGWDDIVGAPFAQAPAGWKSSIGLPEGSSSRI
jgi:hypothetical protein